MTAIPGAVGGAAETVSSGPPEHGSADNLFRLLKSKNAATKFVRIRKDVNVFLYNPSKKFFHVVVELKNLPGALCSVLLAIQNLGINVLGSFSSVDLQAETGIWSAFLEDPRHSASQLKKKISSSPFVLDTIVAESKDGFLADRVHFPLALNTGDPAVMMRSRYVTKMFERVREDYGSGGRAIVFEEGFAYGKETWSEMKPRLGEFFTRSNLRDWLSIYQALGWFKIEELTLDGLDGSVTLRTSGNFECVRSDSKAPHSEFVRGHLAGALTALLGEDVGCEETKCVAVGDQSCEFFLKPVAKAGQQVAAQQVLTH